MIRRVFPYLRPYKWPFIIALTQVFLISALELLKPWPLKLIIDHVLSNKPLPWGVVEGTIDPPTILVLTCLALVLIYLFLGGLTLLNNFTTIKIGQKMVNDLRRDVYSHLQRLSLAFHNRRQVGDLLYRVTADTYSIQSITMNGLFPIVTALLLLTGMFLIMIRIDWVLTLLALAVCPALFLSISLLSGKISKAAMDARQQESEVYSVVQRAMSDPRAAAQFVVSRFKSDACVMGGVAMVMHDILSRPGLDGAQSPRQSGVFASQVSKRNDHSPQLLINHDGSSLISQSSRN